MCFRGTFLVDCSLHNVVVVLYLQDVWKLCYFMIFILKQRCPFLFVAFLSLRYVKIVFSLRLDSLLFCSQNALVCFSEKLRRKEKIFLKSGKLSYMFTNIFAYIGEARFLADNSQCSLRQLFHCDRDMNLITKFYTGLAN